MRKGAASSAAAKAAPLGPVVAKANRGSAAFHRGSPRSGRFARFLPGRTGRCPIHRCAAGTGSASLRGRAGGCASWWGRCCSWGSIPAGPGCGFTGPLGAAGGLSCRAGLGHAGSARSSRCFGGSAQNIPAGGAGLTRFAPGFWHRRPSRMGRAGRPRRCFRRGRRCLPTHGHIGLAGAAYRTAARV